jgi:hypothetical protein
MFKYLSFSSNLRTFNPLIFSPKNKVYCFFFTAHSRRFMSRTALSINFYSFNNI